ncbi:TPA: fimbrial protein [Citrobacter werkmanii]
MKRSIICSALLPFLFAGMAHAAETNVITEDGQLIIKATVEGSSCHFRSNGGDSAIIDMGTISTSDVYKIGIGAVSNTKVWSTDVDKIEVICPSNVALKNITFSPTNISTNHPGLLQDDEGDTTGVGFSVDFYNTGTNSVKIDNNNKVVDVSGLEGEIFGTDGVMYTLKFDARWARLAQVVKAGDVKSTIKFTVETD